MNYILTLEGIEDDGFEANAKVGISFPAESTFSIHTSVATAFNHLIPLLLGEVVEKINIQHEEAEKKKEEEKEKE